MKEIITQVTGSIRDRCRNGRVPIRKEIMNERINRREDRKNRFGDLRISNDMGSVKLGRRDLSQCERLFISIMESVRTALLGTEKEHSQK